MQLPKLTPLQSRLLASVIATCFLVLIWISFQPHHFVYAAELNPLPLTPEVQTHVEQSISPFIPNGQIVELEEEGGGYEPDFAYFDRNLIGRAADGVDALTNNVKKGMDANPGTTHNFVLEKSQVQAKKSAPGSGFPSPLDGRGVENASKRGISGDFDSPEGEEEAELIEMEKRQSGNKPSTNISIVTNEPPQLILYVSTSTNNQKPGPKAENDLATPPIPFVGGHVNFSIQADSDVYIGVSAPSLTTGWTGNWHYEVAASIDGYYHSYNDTSPFLWLIDTDANSALFITYNLTKENSSEEVNKQWMDMKTPFTMYAFAKNDWGKTGAGLERSFCGLQEQFNKAANITVSSDMTKRYGGGGRPKAQLHVQGLTSGATYVGFLAMDGNGTTEALNVPGNAVPQAGGRVWKQFEWTTKARTSCQVIFNLKFCTDVAYAVPSNPKFTNNMTGLASLYDSQASAYFQNFTNSLQQVACDTTGTAQYSLARTCQDCSDDYKQWLCSVLMPRCEDWNATNPWLIDRNIGNPFPQDGSLQAGTLAYANNMTKNFNDTFRQRLAFNTSRNPMIDEVIQPGPYKELLPCEDLCFDIVRSCPAQLGFACPDGANRYSTYGRRRSGSLNLTCNFPGAVVNLNVFRGAAGVGMGGSSNRSLGHVWKLLLWR
ncbi:uncharacterized protein BDR25DRAFT_333966 [Lindgomyces ingoldianus]|uniref:Uncharacterized protein n=1 Tax=Lindgomyces ingoldianus TaxID=673940 RepID=A0ACB6QWC2_9PLEO|nr:uncharacterized protein BDR25DRAFT_333966 [Lindgomyces ingoldianus]KAF2471318.1 hypothetical protein BDR25DRAFT_333966 [Lindgomyces ingoldianus]